jgi:DNA (cytosine-5)-methyltransferase 1
MLTVGSLFSGIGGLDLGFERAGMKVAWQAENNPFAVAILKQNFVNATIIKDVRDVNRNSACSVDVLVGGFPCQDVSHAGKRKGFTGERSSLWREFARIIGDLEPRWVVVENVKGLLSSNKGQDFGEVLADLANTGYDAAWKMLRASDVGAIHTRNRVILVAHRDGQRIQRFFEKEIPWFPALSRLKDVRRVEDLRGRPDVPEPLICRVDHGISNRLVGLGNAVVPQLAEWVALRIIELDSAG